MSFHSPLNSNTVIATKFCTWHDSCAVVACAQICCNQMAGNRITARWSFHRIWIAGKKSLGKRAPGLLVTYSQKSLSHFNSLVPGRVNLLHLFNSLIPRKVIDIYLTQRSIRKYSKKFQIWFSNIYWWLISRPFPHRCILQANVLLIILFMILIRQHKWLGSVRWQAITCTHVDHDHWCISVGEKHWTCGTFLTAGPKCLMGDFTNL